jgi:hypothetical protein
MSFEMCKSSEENDTSLYLLVVATRSDVHWVICAVRILKLGPASSRLANIRGNILSDSSRNVVVPMKLIGCSKCHLFYWSWSDVLLNRLVYGRYVSQPMDPI